MKFALGMILFVAVASFAGSTFEGGCADTFGISGYTKAWYYMYGEDNPMREDTEGTFRGYAYMAFMGRLNDYVYGKVSTEFNTYNGMSSLGVCDAYLNMDIIPELSIKAGQFKIPFGWAYNCAGGGTYFLDRAVLATVPEFMCYGGRDVGVALHGQFDMVGIDVGYFNGNGPYTDADTLHNMELAAQLTVDATEWLTIGAGVAMIGQPDSATVDSEWSATGFDVYVLADYPLSDAADLRFEGEFLQSAYAGPELIGGEWEAGMDYYGMLGVNFQLENSFLTSVMPAVRYETYSQWEYVVTGADRAEDNVTVIDGCVNCYLTPKNDIQIGLRNYGFEADGVDGYTDMYLGWRMNF